MSFSLDQYTALQKLHTELKDAASNILNIIVSCVILDVSSCCVVFLNLSLLLSVLSDGLFVLVLAWGFFVYHIKNKKNQHINIQIKTLDIYFDGLIKQLI
ncbi:hypothetical protein TCON_2840 [Astathelohania contejeani]|uniref:Uncharacterized protein n=1 Tax=Astathelohania contejeani TaxID=164912 RepID=A0ABQ7HV09_9MICR|nr:hypothetical protein TCON_2840 [Thelohania contejeani]